MRGKCTNLLLLVTLLIVCTSFLFSVVGCSNSSVANMVDVEVNGHAISTKHKGDVLDCVNSLNNVAGLDRYNDGIAIDVDYERGVFRVYMGDKLEEMLPLICENYNVSTNWAEAITPEQVRSVINDDFAPALESAFSDDFESYFIYKLFKWCGSSCKDTAVYNSASEWDKADIEKSITSGEETNVKVIQSQVNWAKEGKVSPYKFKWQ